MNLDYEKQLEAEIDRQLKGLPPLTAPPTLASRVMAAIETRTASPWFANAWTAWPFALRTASLVTLLALFGGLSFAAWQLSHTGSDLVTRRFGGGLSLLGGIWDVLSALVGAVALVFRNLSPMFLIGYLA